MKKKFRIVVVLYFQADAFVGVETGKGCGCGVGTVSNGSLNEHGVYNGTLNYKMLHTKRCNMKVIAPSRLLTMGVIRGS